MNKICIIGNSHMGALKLAYDNQKRRGIDFYGSIGKMFSSLYLKDNKLVTDDVQTKNWLTRNIGTDVIPLKEYHHILIYGCGVLSPGWIEYYSNVLSKMYSENCLRQACIDRLNSAFGFQLAKIIQNSNLCEKVTIVPSPLLSEVLKFQNNKFLSSSSPAFARKILDKVELIYKNYLEEYGINLLWNPSELLAKNGFTTDIKYKAEREDDCTHVNSKAGKIILDNIYSYLGI